MLELIFKALAAGLSIWESKEKTKYIDKLEAAKRAYEEEWNKAPADRSDAALDQIRFDLKLLTESFVASVNAKQ